MFNPDSDKSMEKVGKKRLAWGEVGGIVLGVVGTVGMLSIAVIAPKALGTLRLFQQKKSYRYQSPKYIREILERLAKRGLVEIFERDGDAVARLTEKGQRELLRLQLQQEKAIVRKWDGSWRLVIFDIPERWRKSRDRLRIEMLSFGFVRLQDSVWVYPHECEQVVVLLKAEYKIGKELLYIVAKDIENDRELRQHFGLSGD
ncbi:MAG: hypothetical protein ABI747_03545 [Candidatus Moraniibacteriota bacterium]